MDTGTVIILAMLMTFLVLLLTEYFLLKKYYEDGIKELKMRYEDIVETTKKETERKIRSECLKESIEIKQTLIPTKEYVQTIIVDRTDINLLNDKKELMEILRSGFADQFAKEVIKPNLNIQEVMDIDIDLSGRKKYMARMWMGF